MLACAGASKRKCGKMTCAIHNNAEDMARTIILDIADEMLAQGLSAEFVAAYLKLDLEEVYRLAEKIK